LTIWPWPSNTIFSYSVQPIACATGALDLPATLPWVHHRARVGSVDALQDGDLTGKSVHGDTETVNVERNGTRRIARFADRR